MKESSTDGAALDRTAGASRSRDPLDQVTDLDVAALSSRAGVFRGTATDGIVRTNERFAEITGLPTTVRGWDWLVAVHAEDRDRLRRAVEATCERGARSAFPIRMQVQLGRIEALRVEITGTAGADGRFVFVGSVTEDGHTARHRDTTPAAPDVDDPFRVLVDVLPVAVAYTAPDGTLEFRERTVAVAHRDRHGRAPCDRVHRRERRSARRGRTADPARRGRGSCAWAVARSAPR